MVAREDILKVIAKEIEKAKTLSAENRSWLGAQVVSLLAGISESSAAITDFFEAVGSGVVDAQRRLDQESIGYLGTRLPVAPPTVFRIPKVRAEIQFAMKWVKGSKFDVFVYGKHEEQGKSQQNKVEFEIVAAPPPPGAFPPVGTVALLDSLVLSPSERAVLRQHMLQLAADPSLSADLQNSLKGFAQIQNFDRIVVVKHSQRVPPSTPALGDPMERRPFTYVLFQFVPQFKTAKDVDIQLDALSVPPPGDPRPPELGAKGSIGLRQTEGREWWMASVLMDISEWQEQFLPMLKSSAPGS